MPSAASTVVPNRLPEKQEESKESFAELKEVSDRVARDKGFEEDRQAALLAKEAAVQELAKTSTVSKQKATEVNQPPSPKVQELVTPADGYVQRR